MVPYKDGKANHGHSCVKGRFACGYATHKDRILKPMIRAKITDPWREVSLGGGDRLRGVASSSASRRNTAASSVGGITSSRCTNEETFLVQKLVRAAFGNNNVDTCARVCHSPTGYGLKTTFGTSAGTQDFDSVDEVRRDPGHRRQPDRRPSGVRLAHEAAPARGREADRRRSAPHRPGAHAAYRGRLSPAAASPAPTSRVVNALAHVIVTEGLVERGLRARALRLGRVPGLGGVRRRASATRPEAVEKITGVPAELDPRRGAALRHRRQRRDLLRPRRHRAQPGLDHGDGASPTSPWPPAISAAKASA